MMEWCTAQRAGWARGVVPVRCAPSWAPHWTSASATNTRPSHAADSTSHRRNHLRSSPSRCSPCHRPPPPTRPRAHAPLTPQALEPSPPSPPDMPPPPPPLPPPCCSLLHIQPPPPSTSPLVLCPHAPTPRPPRRALLLPYPLPAVACPSCASSTDPFARLPRLRVPLPILLFLLALHQGSAAHITCSPPWTVTRAAGRSAHGEGAAAYCHTSNHVMDKVRPLWVGTWQ